MKLGIEAEKITAHSSFLINTGKHEKSLFSCQALTENKISLLNE